MIIIRSRIDTIRKFYRFIMQAQPHGLDNLKSSGSLNRINHWLFIILSTHESL